MLSPQHRQNRGAGLLILNRRHTSSLFIMLIGYHGSGLFGEARKIMNDTAHTQCV